MWPFSNRGPRLDVEDAMLKHKPDFDFAPFERNDVSIKLWMPEKIITSIDVLSLQHEVSRPDILRWVFFEHAYGRELFAGLCLYEELLLQPEDHMPRFARKVASESAVLYSESRKQVDTERAINQRFLGKATEDVKLWLPRPLKDVLQELADNKDEPLSDYLRSALVRHLFGEQFYDKLQEALASINQRALEHERPVYAKGEQENLIQPPMWS